MELNALFVEQLSGKVALSQIVVDKILHHIITSYSVSV